MKKKSENTKKKKDTFSQFETKPSTKKMKPKTKKKDDSKGVFERERETLKRESERDKANKKKQLPKEKPPGSLTNLIRKRKQEPLKY